MKNCFFAVINKTGRTPFSPQKIKGILIKKGSKRQEIFLY